MSFYKGDIKEEYTPYQSDKKRLLYYSNETQTWEKPILRQWDSIADAARWLVDNGYAKTYNGGVRQKISMCTKGKVKTAYKFIWKI